MWPRAAGHFPEAVSGGAVLDATDRPAARGHDVLYWTVTDCPDDVAVDAVISLFRATGIWRPRTRRVAFDELGEGRIVHGDPPA